MQVKIRSREIDRDRKPRQACNREAVLLAAVLALSLIVVQVSAHPPSDMILGYDTASEILSVTISHDVADPGAHYISVVWVARNGQEVENVRYTSQPDRSFLTSTYAIAADPGDRIRVVADCSIGGSITREISLPVQSQGVTLPQLGENSAVLVLWPYHAVLMGSGVVLLISAVYVVQHGRSWKGWYRYHRLLAVAGGFLMIVALMVANYAVALSGGPHLRVPHAFLGISTISLIILTIVLGIARDRAEKGKARLRTLHLWCGRILLVLIILTAFSGLFTAGVL